MYLLVIGWLYVALMMAAAEATASNGTVLGAIFTFLLYGLAPVALAVYLLGTPGRRRASRAREEAAQRAAEEAAQEAAQEVAREAALKASPAHASSPIIEPDASGEPSADALAPVRKEP